MRKYIKCVDKFNVEIVDGDYVDVQQAGIFQVLKKKTDNCISHHMDHPNR